MSTPEQDPGSELRAIVAVLKALGRPTSITRVRELSLHLLEPRLVLPRLSPADKQPWLRLAPSARLEVTVNAPAWGNAIRALRYHGWLIEDPDNQTWRIGPGSPDLRIDTVGWPDDRARFVVDRLMSGGDHAGRR